MAKLKSLTPILSNLAKAAEQQNLPDRAELFYQLAMYFHLDDEQQYTLQDLKNHILSDLENCYPALQTAGEKTGDHGVLRALKWGQKVTAIQKSLIDRYLAKGDELMEGMDLFVCEACGFIFLGSNVPIICPVCKAPHRRFSMVG